MTRDQKELLNWYAENKRDLPWRKKRDAYSIWISEVMLQQTTVAAVIPYYQRFLERFPDVKILAEAKESEVLTYWAGLGYYSRARMLHRAAKEIAAKGFPEKHRELIALPGFGPYTARSVASLAHGESVGAVDGNVIRVLSRRFGLDVEWWKPKGREEIQIKADELVRAVSSSDVNQALMDLGSSHCSSTTPSCFFCPWMKTCVAFQTANPEDFPRSKPRRSREIWLWEPQIEKRENRILLAENNYAPFLKKQWLPPGRASIQKKAPKEYLFKHSITHHDIYVVPSKAKVPPTVKKLTGQYVQLDKVIDLNPTSLVRKLLELT